MGHSSNNLEKSSETDSIFCHAERLRERSFYPQSLRLFKKALQGYIKTGDRDGIFHCLFSLGDTYRMVGDFDLAAKSYAGIIELAKKNRAPIKVADAKVGLGLSLRAQGKWKEAIKFIHESRKIYKRKGDSEGIAFTLWAEAGALRIKGDIPGAIKVFKESHKIFKSMKDTQGIGYCLCGLGGASRIAGRFKDSLNYYTSANRLFSHMKDTFGKAYSYCGIGNAYRMLRDYKRALTHFSQATKLYEKMGDKVSYSYTLWGIATTHKMIGNYKKAHGYLTKAIMLFKKTRDPRGLIYCRLGLGEIDILKGKKTFARRHLLASLHESNQHDFAVEKCHTKTLITYMNRNNTPESPPTSSVASRTDLLKRENPPTSPFNKGGLKGDFKEWQGKFSGEIDNECYNRLGLKLRFQALPLNIP
jgi:tetratricopeptide (TPR) repeat protein